MPIEKRDLDLVLWGATGFTGKLVAEYLLARYGAGPALRWALGGRNRGKLVALRTSLGPAAADLPLCVGDGHDERFLTGLAASTRVVCSTVGPYARYGAPLVAACVSAGTHYCDLTGELPWIRRMIDQHAAAAAQTGARIVHSCGFDSIPSDIGVFFLQQEMQQRHGTTSPHIKYRVRRFKGGFSGGTVASMLDMMRELEHDRSLRALLADPYALNPREQRCGPDGRDPMGPAYDADFDAWTAPFIMATLNTRIVRRTNALLDYAYGKDFRYDEAMLMGGGPIGLAKASALAVGLGSAMVAGAIRPLREMLARWLPAPGEGPSLQERETGFFDIELVAAHPSDARKSLRARVYGDRDPGYGSTAKMLGESAVCLAMDELSIGGGFWTTAAAMGAPLLRRLNQNAGVSFSVI